MARRIDKVAVLGAGTMGAQIAAHVVNAGKRCLLLDIVPPKFGEDDAQRGWTEKSREFRNKFAAGGLERARKISPAAFFHSDLAARVEIGNFDDDLARIAECDWVIEVIVEDMAIKRALVEKLDRLRKPGTIVSSNTSGLPLRAIAEGRSEDFRKHWLGTHFFNPPRYMKLLELITTPDTLPEVRDTVVDFADRVLGKGIVFAKDVPNFIANRIGIFGFMYVVKTMLDDGYTVDEVDALTGPAAGRPKSATFRTLDIVGLDVVAHVIRNLHDGVPNDPQRDIFKMPEFMEKMLTQKWFGEKTGQGFYKKVKTPEGSDIHTLDPKTLQYGPKGKAGFPSLAMTKTVEDPAERFKMLVQAQDRGGAFVWKTTSEVLCYAANRIPEISDDILNVDRAMRWGFNWDFGPFETWDLIGVETAVKRLETEQRAVPPLVRNLLASGRKSFYERREGTTYFHGPAGQPVAEPEPPGVVVLRALKERNRVVKKNPGASLIDLGDGILCCEFHSKMNAIGGDNIQMVLAGIKEAEANFEGLVVANQGANFCVGANLMMILLLAQEQIWEEIDMAVRAFQGMTQGLRYCKKPVVVAPFQLTLGGGCETALGAHKVQAAAETYMGLVEVGVGLIPAGGGTKEMYCRAVEAAPPGVDLFPFIRRAFETIAMAKVATSADEARAFGFLRPTDGISMNLDRLVADAKQACLGLARSGFRPPTPRTAVPVLGSSAMGAFRAGVHQMLRGGYISEYDQVIGLKIARVLSGGDWSGPATVDEGYLLDLERDAFLSLCGERKTLERIQAMLKTGKPLRN